MLLNRTFSQNHQNLKILIKIKFLSKNLIPQQEQKSGYPAGYKANSTSTDMQKICGG
jgi:hypothetical protein